MKKNLFSFLAFLFVAIFVTSCNPDPCKDVKCENAGSCIDGTCFCATGWTGTNCTTLKAGYFTNASGAAVEIRSLVVGDWNVSSGCVTNSFVTNITAGDAVSEVKINLGALKFAPDLAKGTLAVGTVAYDKTTSITTVTIASQSVKDTDGDTWTVSGTMSLTGAILTSVIRYQYAPSSVDRTCTETGTK